MNLHRKSWDIELKPQNTDKRQKKLNGGGSFNDYTPERFEKDLAQNPKVLACGYVKGHLVYILELDFRCLKNKIEQALRSFFGEDLKRKKNQYLRSLSFSFKDHIGCKNLKVVYVSKNLDNFKDYISKELFLYLKNYENH